MSDRKEVIIARQVAAFGLRGTRDPDRVTPGTSWSGVRARVREDRITGLAVESVAAGWLELSDEQVDQLLELHRKAMVWGLRVEGKLLALADAFDGEGIRFAVLKGASVAHTAYPEPCLRSFADLDLLVRPADYDKACALLGSLGHVRRRPEPRPGWEARFGKASVHKRPDDKIEIDLHRTLVLGPFGLWIQPEALLERATRFTLGGRSIPRLDDTGMLLNVAMHASLGWRPPRLVPLRDVVQVANAMEVDWAALAAWAGEWRLSVVLRHAFATATKVLGADPVAGFEAFTRARPRRGDLRALQAYVGEDRGRGGTAISTLRAIPGLRHKAAYAGALAFPQRDFLQVRYSDGSRGSYVRRLMTPSRWAWRRLAAARSKEK